MAGLDNEWWDGKKVLITGHTGFVGSWLSIAMLELGAKVSGISDVVPTRPSLFEAAHLSSKVDDFRLDIRKIESVRATLNRVGPQIIFHLAAQPLVKESYRVPRDTVEVNVLGTLNLLEVLRESRSNATLINMTSDKCYENYGSKNGYKEGDALGGRDPYSASKACSELITRAYRDSFFAQQGGNSLIRVASIRAGNIIGGGDWAQNRLVPDFIRAIEENSPLVVRYPHATRPWQHVLDVVNAMCLLSQDIDARPGTFCDAWNIGPDHSHQWSVLEVLQHIKECWGDHCSWRLDEEEQEHEEMLLALDNTKAKEKLNWQPIWKTARAIEETVSWYRKYLQDSADTYKVTSEQFLQFKSEC